MNAAELYDQRTRRRTEDIGAYVRLLHGARSVLEVGSGTGRVLAGLHDVPRRVGVERSPEFHAIAQRRLGHESGVALINADFGTIHHRSLPRGADFDAVLFSFNVLSEFLSTEDRVAALRRAAGLLGPDGRIILDNDLPDFTSWARGDAAYEFVFHGECDGRPCDWQCQIRCERDLVAQLSNCEVRYVAMGVGHPEIVDSYRCALLTRGELLALFMAAGLRVVAEYGSFDLDPVDATSERVIHVLGIA